MPPTPADPARTAILTVDDDPDVSRAVARDLRRRYGSRYRIVRAESGQSALDALHELKLRGDQVAVILADYRMPQMNGVEFLERAMDVYPGARRDPAHRLRRHQRRDRRDQRRRPRPLPAQAVGSAGGEALPGGGHPAGDLAGLGPPRGAGDQGDRSPLVRPVVGGARVPGPQPGALPLVRLRRAGGQAAAGGGRRGRAHAARGDHAGARCPGRAVRRGTGRPRGPGHHAIGRLLRPHRHRRRPGRPRRGRLRGVRGPADRAGGAHRDRRAGRPELPDRELPGFPGRGVRRAAHHARPSPGRQVRRGGAHHPRGDRPGDQWLGPDRALLRRVRAGRAQRDPVHRCRVPPADRAGPPAADRVRRLLRLLADRGGRLRRQRRLHRRAAPTPPGRPRSTWPAAPGR